MAKIRHISRVTSLQALVAFTVKKNSDGKEVFDYVLKEFAPELYDKEYAKKIFFGVLKNREPIDEKLRKLAPKWPIEKLSSIERCVLEIGAYELMFEMETPFAVVLDEAIELAKEFGDHTAGKFINGVLSSLAKEVRK